MRLALQTGGGGGSRGVLRTHAWSPDGDRRKEGGEWLEERGKERRGQRGREGLRTKEGAREKEGNSGGGEGRGTLPGGKRGTEKGLRRAGS